MKIKNLLFICISFALVEKFMLNNLQINYPTNNLWMEVLKHIQKIIQIK